MTENRIFYKLFLSDFKKNLKRSRAALIFGVTANALFTIIYIICAVIWFYRHVPVSSLLPAKDITYTMQYLNFSFAGYLIFGLLAVPVLFFYLFHKHGPDLYHATPIPRTVLALSRFSTIAVIYAAAAAVQILLVLASLPVMGQMDLTFEFWPVAGSLIVSMVTGLAAVSVCIFCIVVSDRLDRYVYYVAGLAVMLPLGAILLLRMPQQHAAGFYIKDAVAGYLFPTDNAGLILTGQGNHWLQLISMVCVCALCLWAACKFYKSSCREDMGKSPYLSVPVRLIQLGVQLFCIAFLSFLMNALTLGYITGLKFLREQPVLAVAFGLPVSFLVTLLAERILSKKRRYKGALLQWGIVSLTAVAAALLFQTCIMGDGYELKAEDVESVSFSDNLDSGDNRNGTYFAFLGSDHMPFRANIDDRELTGGYQNVALKDSESIEAVLALHQESLNFFHNAKAPDLYTTYTVTYYLKNGKKLTRSLPYSNKQTYDKDDKKWDYKSEVVLGNAFRRVKYLPECIQAGNPLFTESSDNFIAVYLNINTLVEFPYDFEKYKNQVYNYDNLADFQFDMQKFFSELSEREGTADDKEQIVSKTVRDNEFISGFMKAFRQDMLESRSAVSHRDGKSPIISVGRVGFFYNPKVSAEQQDAISNMSMEQLLHTYSLREGENTLFEYRYFDIPATYQNTMEFLSNWVS